MLVLSRRIDERIMIGNDIVITVLEIHHDHVRIGIDAPRSIDVHREEVFRLVKAANVAAVTNESASLESLRSLAENSGSEHASRPQTDQPNDSASNPVARLRKPKFPPKS